MSTTRGDRQAKLVTAASYSDLQRSAASELLAGDPQGMWIVSGQRLAANRLLYRVLGDGYTGLGGIERGSLFQCAMRIALPTLAADGVVTATRLGIEATVMRALRSQAPDLRQLRRVIDARGLPARVASTLDDLRNQLVTADRVGSADPTGQDLGRILAAYEEALAGSGIVDRVGVYEMAIAGLAAERTPPFGGLLALDQPLRSAVEERFVAALAEVGVACTAVVLRADRDSVDRFARAWSVDPEGVDEEATQASALRRLRSRLFADRDPHTGDGEGAVEILSAAGEDREAVEIARRIWQLADRAEDGDGRFDRMGIAVRSPGIYQPVLEEAFSRAGIPAFFSRGTLRPDPAGRAFLALLRCRAEGYSATRFAEYLSLGQVPADPAEPRHTTPWRPAVDASVIPAGVDEVSEEPQLALEFDARSAAAALEPAPRTSFPRRWERLLVEASVIGGYDRWRERLQGLEQELQARLDHVLAEDPSRTVGIRRTLDQVRNLQQFALPLIEQLGELPDEADVGDWIPALESLAKQSLRRPRRVLALLADLRPMAGVGSMQFGEIRHLLEQRLGELRLEPEGSLYGKVFVGTPEEFRGLSFATVFVCGLAEGIFPQGVREDPLLLDEARRQLDAGLQVNDDRVAQERLRLQIAVAAVEDRLVISFPTWDGMTGRARVPSFYAFDSVAAAGGGIEELSEGRSAPAVPLDPSAAIDDAEFDIAVLLPLLAAGHGPRGRCNYLIHTNPHLARSLRARGRRWLNFLSPVDGLVDPGEDVLRTLETFRLRRHSYSPTSLQHYAACPYRFYLHGILRLRPREEIEALEQLDPLTRGSLYHAIQFAFLRSLAVADLLEFSTSRETELLEWLDTAIERVAGEYAERLRPALPAVYAGEVEGIRTDLRGWLRQVVEDDAYTPSHFELAFGLPTDNEHDPASRTDPASILDRLLAKGSIDMVERSRESACRVTDHKTGAARDTRNLTVGGGEALQPLIYAYAARELLGTEVVSGRLWYSTRRGRYQSLEVPTGEYQQQSLETVLETIDGSVASGFFPAAPRASACRYCDYRSVCGPHEELRFDIKKRNPETRERLTDLIHLRSME